MITTDHSRATEMGKLGTVPTSWDHLSRVPALEHRNPAAIESPEQ